MRGHTTTEPAAFTPPSTDADLGSLGRPAPVARALVGVLLGVAAGLVALRLLPHPRADRAAALALPGTDAPAV